MKLSIKEMISGGPSRLRYVYRYSTSRVNHPESVAEHSYYVAFYCLLISRWVEENQVQNAPEVLDSKRILSLLQRALLHDLEEGISGDFPRNFKRSSPELKQMLETASQKAFEQVIEPVTGIQTTFEMLEGDESLSYDSDGDVTDEYVYSWLNAKDGTLPGRILEFADFLAVLGFIMEEKESGNQGIEKHVRDMDKYFEVFKQDSFDFLRPLIQQTEAIMEEVF